MMVIIQSGPKHWVVNAEQIMLMEYIPKGGDYYIDIKTINGCEIRLGPFGSVTETVSAINKIANVFNEKS